MALKVFLGSVTQLAVFREKYYPLSSHSYSGFAGMSVKLVEAPNKSRFPFSNCLLIERGPLRVLVDTGCTPNEPPGSFDAVVYTHFHPDHIRGCEWAVSRARKIFAPEGEKPYRSLSDLAVRFAPGMEDSWLAMASSIGLSCVPKVDEYYRPGEDLCVGSICIKTYPARGHLLTHNLIEAYNILHLVDIDLTGFGPWYANPEADPSTFLADIEAAATIKVSRYVTAHKQGYLDRSDAVRSLAGYAKRLVEQAEAVHKALSSSEAPLKPRDLTGRGLIYRRYLPGFENIMGYFEASMIEKLLGLLYIWGCTRREREGWVASDCDLQNIKESVAERILSYM